MENLLFDCSRGQHHQQQQPAQQRVVNLACPVKGRAMSKQRSPEEMLQTLVMYQARNQLGGWL